MVLVVMPVLAQRGGGGHASGGHAGFSGHAAGGGRFGGMRSGSGPSRGLAGSRQSYSRQPFSRPQSLTRRGTSINHRGIQIRSFNARNCFGCRRFGYPWGDAGFYDPYWWWDSGSSYDQDYENDRALADQMNQESLQEQQMRQQAGQDVYARPPAQPDTAQSVPTELIPPTVLVFHDQHKQEVQNYAIVGQTLWNFSGQRTQKIPLSDLDLIATAEANEARGGEFRLPRPSEGQ